jgi:hypothetical protein
MATRPPRTGGDDAVPDGSEVVSALPPKGARILAFVSIVVAGACGGLIGWSIADLQCHGNCATIGGIGALVGALIGAGGVATVAVLVLRAMGEWRTIQETGDPTAPRRARRPS